MVSRIAKFRVHLLQQGLPPGKCCVVEGGVGSLCEPSLGEGLLTTPKILSRPTCHEFHACSLHAELPGPHFAHGLGNPQILGAVIWRASVLETPFPFLTVAKETAACYI